MPTFISLAHFPLILCVNFPLFLFYCVFIFLFFFSFGHKICFQTFQSRRVNTFWSYLICHYPSVRANLDALNKPDALLIRNTFSRCSTDKPSVSPFIVDLSRLLLWRYPHIRYLKKATWLKDSKTGSWPKKHSPGIKCAPVEPSSHS